MKAAVITLKKVFKPAYVVKFGCFSFCCYLLFLELDKILSKPIILTTAKSPISANHQDIPDIYVCADPAFDTVKVKQHGFDSLLHYVMGVKHWNLGENHVANFSGWQSTNEVSDSSAILDDIVTVNNTNLIYLNEVKVYKYEETISD